MYTGFSVVAAQYSSERRSTDGVQEGIRFVRGTLEQPMVDLVFIPLAC